jgi:hypothetical protein
LSSLAVHQEISKLTAGDNPTKQTKIQTKKLQIPLFHFPFGTLTLSFQCIPDEGQEEELWKEIGKQNFCQKVDENALPFFDKPL